MFPESNETKFLSHSFQLQNSGIFSDQNGQKRGPHETEF